MSRPDSGYATVTVTALMLGLSVLAITWMERSLVASRSADRLGAQILSDIHVEGALYEALGLLVNSRGLPESSLRDMHFSSGDLDAVVSISSVRDLIDINAAPIDEIENALKRLGLPPLDEQALMRRITETRGDGDTPFLSLADLASGVDAGALIPCLEQSFTVFHDPSPPIRRGESAKLGEGSLVRIRAHAPGRNGALEAVVLVTGLREEPYWIFDWKHLSEPTHASC